MFFKVIYKKGFTRLTGLFASIQIRELMNRWFRFLDVANWLKNYCTQQEKENTQK